MLIVRNLVEFGGPASYSLDCISKEYGMITEREKMPNGELYNALDPDLIAARNRARDLCQALNTSREADQELRKTISTQLFGKGRDTVWMQPPFYCDYGSNIELGERVFFNFNCILSRARSLCASRNGRYGAAWAIAACSPWRSLA